MHSSQTKLSGIIPPMITPLTDKMDIDVDALYLLANYLIDGGVSGIFALGTSGEGPWLTSTQQSKVITELVRCVDGVVPVLAGALEPSTTRTIEAIQRHSDDGADIAVITSPYYFGCDATVQIRHIETIAEKSPLPVMLYNIPQMTHNPLLAETVQEVIHIDKLIGIKDSAGDWENFSNLLQYREKRPDFAIFQGAEKLSMKSLVSGADGIVPGLGNLIPQHFVALTLALQAQNHNVASAIQKLIDELWELHTHDYWLSCLKYAASLLGFGSGATLDRTSHLSDESKKIIASLMEDASDESSDY